MKKLNVYLNESIVKDDLEILYNRALEVIDYFNQEAVRGFEEDDWKKYCKGQGEPKWEDIINEICGQMKDNNISSEQKILRILDKYPNTPNKDDIESTILRAAKKYIKGLPGA